jgi:hypothetical protein
MAFLTALTALTAGAVAGPVEDGNAAYQRGEIAPELTGYGLPLSKCEAYNRVYEQQHE